MNFGNSSVQVINLADFVVQANRNEWFDGFPTLQEFFEMMVPEDIREKYNNDPTQFYLVLNGNNRTVIRKCHPDYEIWVS